MNVFVKYCPNVWVAKCEAEHNKGEFIVLNTKHNKEVMCEVHNKVYEKDGFFYYSVTRCDGTNRQTYAEKKAERYRDWAGSAERKSSEWYEKSREGRDFLSLGEPIKVGHHSENRHRALLARNSSRMKNSIAESDKAEKHLRKAAYWDSRVDEINLSMPESIEFFEHELKKAEERQAGLKNGTIERRHSYSLPYASKLVKEIKKKLEIAKVLWG